MAGGPGRGLRWAFTNHLTKEQQPMTINTKRFEIEVTRAGIYLRVGEGWDLYIGCRGGAAPGLTVGDRVLF